MRGSASIVPSRSPCPVDFGPWPSWSKTIAPECRRGITRSQIASPAVAFQSRALNVQWYAPGRADADDAAHAARCTERKPQRGRQRTEHALVDRE